ncbi:MAG: zinc ribbon domain-containing protein [Chloroflexi bacterium]|nr:zinc ribbon domain-containing protein [Chloroflexota bacterium]
MPLYEYFCPQCQKEFELMRPLSKAEEPASCPRCGTRSEKLVSTFAARTGSYIRPPEGPPLRKFPEPPHE